MFTRKKLWLKMQQARCSLQRWWRWLDKVAFLLAIPAGIAAGVLVALLLSLWRAPSVVEYEVPTLTVEERTVAANWLEARDRGDVQPIKEARLAELLNVSPSYRFCERARLRSEKVVVYAVQMEDGVYEWRKEISVGGFEFLAKDCLFTDSTLRIPTVPAGDRPWFIGAISFCAFVIASWIVYGAVEDVRWSTKMTTG